MSRGLNSRREERYHDLCTPLPLLYYTAPKKTKNGYCEQRCEEKSTQKIQVEVVVLVKRLIQVAKHD